MIYDYIVKNQKGEDISLEQYKGKVLLIVNTATGCGFTPQYTELQTLYEQHKQEGFEILDFPCNQFNNQAPGSDQDIHTFCTLKYNITFPQFSKVDVKGVSEEPLFKFLKESKRGFFTKQIKWNFTKFLVDRDGKVVKRFAPNVNPSKIEDEIIKLL